MHARGIEAHAACPTRKADLLICALRLTHASHKCVCPACRVGLTHKLEDEDVVQLVKKKVKTGEDGKGRFKGVGEGRKPDRIADREKKAPLKS